MTTKPLDEFNWQFNRVIDRRRFDELATSRVTLRIPWRGTATLTSS